MPRVSNLIGGKYRLLERIGEGSMGSVWKAMHETLERPFAVKFLKDYECDSTRLEDRFLSEARVSAAVRHRSIVDVVDFGRTDEGTPYMVMELLEGASLGWRLMQPDPPPVLEVMAIMQQALAGLEAVHRAGILHRDLKPENIVLVCEEGEIVAKVIDFGISRPLKPDPARGSGTARGLRLTMPGTTVGTPWYMAPEQAQALPTMDHRADIYAMGVILYEACAGQLPFEHEDMHMLLLLVAAGGARPLSTHRPDLPAALSDAIARAMDPDPESRFSSAAEFAAALREIARDIPADAYCRQRRDAFTPVARMAASRPPPESFVAEAPRETTPAPALEVAALPEATATISPSPPDAQPTTELASPQPPAVAIRDATTRLNLPANLARGAILVPRAVWAKFRHARFGQRPLFVASGAVVAAASVVLLLALGDGEAPVRRPAMVRSSFAGAAVPARVPLIEKNLGTNAATGPGALNAAVAMPTVATTPGTGAAAPAKRRPRRPPEVFRTPGF
ncbi:MAG TPA: protein kinase [Polyangia bacterium]